MTRSVLSGSWRDRKKARRSRVWLDGVEVTRHCQVADDRAGRVLLLKVNAEGRHYADMRRGVAAKEWRHGQVIIGRM